ncbi:MAG: hypothetical protein HDQ96_13945 [Lachnospiraceae bacterium]|nr:hypothetical protein [Lachnospiraceae bacterium]
MGAQVRKSRLRTALYLLAVLFFFGGGLLLIHTWEENRESDVVIEEEEEELLYYEGVSYRKKEGLDTILILGIDKYALEEEEPGQHQSVQGEYEQSDFLMLLVFDKDAENCQVIHINRDTMTEIRELSNAGKDLGTFIGQLTLAHAYGGGDGQMRCRNTVRSVSRLFYGINIDHYVSIAMDGIEVLNDAAGGVTVTVMDDFSGINDRLVQGEEVKLMGQDALTYVRVRYGLEDSSNLHRMERQYQYLTALQEQLMVCVQEDPEFLTNTLMEINPYLVTDCTVQQLSVLSETVEECGGIQDYQQLEGEAILNEEENHIEFYPDEDALLELVVETFYERAE